MNRKLLNCILIIIVFFIGISLGTSGKSSDGVDDFENSITEPNNTYEGDKPDVAVASKGFVNGLAKEAEGVIDSIFGLIFDLIGGGIKVVLGG